MISVCDAYLLDVVVAEGAAVLELFAGEDQALLVGRNAFLVLDLGLDIVDRVGGLDLKGDGLAREGLDEAVGRESVYVIPACARLRFRWRLRGLDLDNRVGGLLTFALDEC
jgi:hypothetical protein